VKFQKKDTILYVSQKALKAEENRAKMSTSEVHVSVRLVCNPQKEPFLKIVSQVLKGKNCKKGLR
jgi:hypothetical protein